MPPVPRSLDKRLNPLPVWAFAIVFMIAAVLFFSGGVVVSPHKAARHAAAEATVASVASMLRNYNLETGSYPATLDAMVPKYLEKPPLDAWKRPLVYTRNPSGPPRSVGSLGADGQTGGSGDEADIWAQVP